MFGIVGDTQTGLSSTARDELGVFRDGQKSSGSVSALRALQEAQKFNTDVSPSVVPLLLCIFLRILEPETRAVNGLPKLACKVRKGKPRQQSGQNPHHPYHKADSEILYLGGTTG